MLNHSTADWDLSDFTSASVVDGVEILLSADGKRALVVWPWHANPEVEVRRAANTAQAMGYTTITEVGNLTPYRVPGADTGDSDFMLMEAE